MHRLPSVASRQVLKGMLTSRHPRLAGRAAKERSWRGHWFRPGEAGPVSRDVQGPGLRRRQHPHRPRQSRADFPHEILACFTSNAYKMVSC